MFADIDLRALAEMTAPERAFLSVYLSGPRSAGELSKKFTAIRRLLSGDGPARDEREHFDENASAVLKHLEQNTLASGAFCLFSCWALDFLQAVEIAAPVKDLVRIDSSPYIRPLAELRDEYENVAVVVADNRRARIFLVSSAVAGPEETVRGNVKNHVRKGGWSQQRYERRRDKQLLAYVREIADALARLDQEETFRRIVLVGGKEALAVLYENLPQALRDKVSQKAIDLGSSEAALNADIMDLFVEAERRSEKDLWERIKGEVLRGGLGVVGLDEVLWAARAGQVESMIVDRTYRPEGRRCRDCGNLEVAIVEACTACGSDSLFTVDVVNELVGMLELTGASADFADPIESLTGAGGIGALLRY